MSNFPLLTRKDVSELARKEAGIPLPVSRIDKDAAAGRGPKLAARYGRVHLYNLTDARKYIAGLIERVEPSPHRPQHRAA